MTSSLRILTLTHHNTRLGWGSIFEIALLKLVLPCILVIQIWTYNVCELAYYPRDSFREGLCNHRRTFVCLSVCLLPR